MCLGIPGEIVKITSTNTAMVDVGGVQRSTDITCVIDEGKPLESLLGEWVLVHVGFAMSKIDKQEAAATLALLDELGELQEDLNAYEEQSVNTAPSKLEYNEVSYDK